MRQTDSAVKPRKRSITAIDTIAAGQASTHSARCSLRRSVTRSVAMLATTGPAILDEPRPPFARRGVMIPAFDFHIQPAAVPLEPQVRREALDPHLRHQRRRVAMQPRPPLFGRGPGAIRKSG